MTLSYTDDMLKDVLRSVRTIAAVGVSVNPVRPSYYVARYLSLRGYRVIPVNPAHAGKTVFGETIRPDLASLDVEGVDMVEIFRRSEHAGAVVDEAIELLGPRGSGVVWMQIGVVDHDAARRAKDAGLTVVMNRCPKIEYQRLFGELRMAGFNTGIISSRL